MRIGIVAAEPSGDLLAAGLMAALRERLPDVEFEGVAGPMMRDVGVDEWASMDTLSVMGLFEVVRHLPRLLRLHRRLFERWRAKPPTVFIGVDAPDFNLRLEDKLHKIGVPTVHYVSPTVWAWRAGRVHTIRRAVDLLLTIFPFERAFLERHRVSSHYVGHPLAASMPLDPDRTAVRHELCIDPAAPVLAILPGSRGSEVSRLSRPFLQSARELKAEMPDLQLMVPLVNERTREVVERIHAACCPDLPIHVSVGNSREVMAAADVVLTASGTATLEGLLNKRPMVVGYKVSPATYLLAKWLRLLQVRHVAMANLLADEQLAPELIQARCEPAHLVPALRRFFDDVDLRRSVAARYREIHEQLRSDTNREAARAVEALLREKGLV